MYSYEVLKQITDKLANEKEENHSYVMASYEVSTSQSDSKEESKAKDDKYYKGYFEVKKEFSELAKPLIEFLNKHYNPMTKIVVGVDGAEILQSEMCYYDFSLVVD